MNRVTNKSFSIDNKIKLKVMNVPESYEIYFSLTPDKITLFPYSPDLDDEYANRSLNYRFLIEASHYQPLTVSIPLSESINIPFSDFKLSNTKINSNVSAPFCVPLSWCFF